MDDKVCTKMRLNRSQLKWIALVLMIIDHAACALCDPSLPLYFVLRMIFGRIAYPIFCVLFVEGFFYTRHKMRHIVDLMLFGLVSEPFFNYVVSPGQWFYPEHQNMMLAWAFCFIVMLGYDALQNALAKNACTRWECWLLGLSLFVGACWLATVLQLDYIFVGIMCVSITYQKYNSDKTIKPWYLGLIVGLIDGLSCMNPAPVLASVVLAFYDREKSVVSTKPKSRFIQKYIFYVAYPLHLAILSVIRLIVL